MSKTASIKLRSACCGTVHIATLVTGRKVLYETRAWGAAANAYDDAKGRAIELGLKLKQ